MAKEIECPFYSICGFVKWRVERPDSHTPPLPQDGDCGKIAAVCGRINSEVPIDPEKYGPQTSDEIKIGFPAISKDNGRVRRLVGDNED